MEVEVKVTVFVNRMPSGC